MLVRPSGTHGEVVAFGHPAALEKLGATLDTIPAPLVRGARAVLSTVPDFASTADEVTGAWLKLTPQARRLLDEHEAVRTGEGLLGVVRDANGKFGGQLTFVEPAVGALANAPALAATAALQVQMVAIEARLEAIHADLGYLIDSAHLEIESELAANLDILDDVFSEVTTSGELTNTQWDRVVNIEASVRRLHHRSSGHLRRLEEALNAEAAGLGEQVKKLKQAIQTNHSDLWLDVHVHAEKALTQWQALYLLRQVDEHPARAAEFAGALKAEVTLRFQSITQLGDTIADSLMTGHTKSWTDRFRITSQARLRHLLAELDQILSSYAEGVDVIQLNAGTAAALDRASFEIGSWRDLAPVAGATDTRLLERLRRVRLKVMPSRQTGSKLARSTLTTAGGIIERLSPNQDDQE